MNKRFYSETEINELKKRKIFKPEILPEASLAKILDRMQNDGFRVWSIGEINFKENFSLGYNICGRCGRFYQITPINDAYKSDNPPYRICDSCSIDRTKIKI